jgi:hypothetical protein
VSANRAIVPQVRVRFEKRLILDPFPVPSPVLPGVCEPGSACPIRVGAIASTFEAAREIPSVYIVLCYDYSNSLDMYMVNLMENSEKHELGPWHPELFPEFSADTRSRIKFFYRRNHPCQQVPDGLDKRDHPRLCVYQCPHFSMKTVGLHKLRDTMLCFDDDKIC